MGKEIKAFINASYGTAVGLLTISLVMFIIFLLYQFLNSIGLKFVVELNALVLGITILATFGVALYIYNINKENKKESESQRQIDLLESLYVELDTISTKKKGHKFKEGNLQWFNEALGLGDPLHSVWKLNHSPYLSYLSSMINEKETGSLKRNVVKLHQKIEMINNIVLSGKYNLRKYESKGTYDQVMSKFVNETIKESIGIAEKMKKRIKKIINFN